MAKPTKIELEQINTRLAADNEVLRGKLSVAVADIARLNQQLLNVTSVASALNAPRVNDPTARAEAMRQAREIAMATGISVKVM